MRQRHNRWERFFVYLTCPPLRPRRRRRRTEVIPMAKILIAEDDPINQRFVSAILERMGHAQW